MRRVQQIRHPNVRHHRIVVSQEALRALLSWERRCAAKARLVVPFSGTQLNTTTVTLACN
jgi:hypothetical protein